MSSEKATQTYTKYLLLRTISEHFEFDDFEKFLEALKRLCDKYDHSLQELVEYYTKTHLFLYYIHVRQRKKYAASFVRNFMERSRETTKCLRSWLGEQKFQRLRKEAKKDARSIKSEVLDKEFEER